MDIRPIKTEADYEWALAEIAPYFEEVPEPGSAEGDRFDVLAGLIDAYESKVWPIDAPDPVDAIASCLADKRHSRAELVALIGSASRTSEVLARKRRLTVDMIYKISTAWHIPADVLVRPYQITQ